MKPVKIPLSRPDITQKDIDSVVEVLKTPNLSLGPKLSEFERKLAEFTGTQYAVAVSSGTTGLHLCVRALGIREGDEVITTPFSFVASANVLLYERAKPVFVDIDPETLNIDASRVEERIEDTTRALLPVHVFGYPCDMDPLVEMAARHNLKIIEDACEAIGAEYNGQRVGTFGDCGVFAFYPNKQMTTGEGGVIVTDNREIAQACRIMRNQGRESRWLEHPHLGFNYRISDINCALGIAQLQRIHEMLDRREHVAQGYHERLKELNSLRILGSSPYVKRSWFVYVVILDSRFTREDRNGIISALANKGIETNDYFAPIHLQPFYREMFGYKRGDFPVTESVSDRTIALPFYNHLGETEIDYVCEQLKGELGRKG
jgi:perosamine synthetase